MLIAGKPRGSAVLTAVIEYFCQEEARAFRAPYAWR